MRIYYIKLSSLKKLVVLLLAALLVTVTLLLCLNRIEPAVLKISAPVYQGVTGHKNVAFTFNVDWGEEYLPSLLKVLKEHEIKATFFITGRWAKAHPELVQKIASEGHEIGNHGYQHQHVKEMGADAVEEEIKEAEIVLQGITGKKPVLYAPAFGEYNKTIGDVAARLNYRVVMWSLDTIDWQNPGRDTIVKRVIPRIHNDAIILMHPTGPTVEALPIIVKELKKEGYQFMTVSALIEPQKQTEPMKAPENGV